MFVEHEYPQMDIHVFMDISLQLSMLLISIWISIDFYGYPCIDLLWILDPGMVSKGVELWKLGIDKSEQVDLFFFFTV